jgi:hypothetical protein
VFNRGIFIIVIAMIALFLCSCTHEISAHAQPDSEPNAVVCLFI